MGRRSGKQRKPLPKPAKRKTGDQLIAERRKRDRKQIQQWERERLSRPKQQGWRDDFSSRKPKPITDGLPTDKDLETQFQGIPADPWTGYPMGYISFAVELESRRAHLWNHPRRERAYEPSISSLEFLDGLRQAAEESVRPI